jgi:hypothetical protein
MAKVQQQPRAERETAIGDGFHGRPVSAPETEPDKREPERAAAVSPSWFSDPQPTIRTQLASFRPTTAHAQAAAAAGHSVDGLVRQAVGHLEEAANAIRQLASLATGAEVARILAIASMI